MDILKKILIALVVIIFTYILWRLIVKRNQIINKLNGNTIPDNIKESFFSDPVASELTGLNDTSIKINMTSFSKAYYSLPLIECCIKGSYNSAFTGNNINVNMLFYLLSRGCRFFDFEVYYIQDPKTGLYTPQVAYGIDGKYIALESQNAILLDNVLSALVSGAFSSQKSPNSNDPLFINLRIKSNNTEVYRAVASSIDYSIKSKLYTKPVTQNTLIKDLMGYIVLSFDKTINYQYKNFTSCTSSKTSSNNTCYDLTKFVNIESGSEDMNLNRYTNILSQNYINLQMQDDNLHTNISSIKDTINLILPDFIPENAPNPETKQFIIGYGCQIVPMKFYKKDKGLHEYESFFNDNNAGIVPLSVAIMYYQKLDRLNT